MSFETGNDLLKMLMALGYADADGKPLSPARIDPSSTVSGTVQNTVYTLNTVTLPANFLNSARRGFVAIASLLTAANANAKSITLKLGATALCTIAGSDNAKTVTIVVIVWRTAVNAQFATAFAMVDGALVAASSIHATAAELEASALAVTLNSANTAAAAASGTSKGLVVIPLG
jgi:hypothetical protein